MLDDNWETINGPIAHRIEIWNARSQINVVNCLVEFLLAHTGPMGSGGPPMPDEAQLKELHRAATLFLLADAGSYRIVDVAVGGTDGSIAHPPPRWQFVPGMMQGFFRDLSSLWTSGDALDAAAFALWRINWIHPFRNGNGRTARAFSYACLSLKLGAPLPGTTTVIDQLIAHRARYEEAVRVADSSVATGSRPDLAVLRDLLHELLEAQIRSIP